MRVLDPSSKPDISIIIPALNEASVLAETLSELPQAPDLEIIVVDGGSLDGTWDLAGRFPQVRRVKVSAGRGYQMNAGAMVSRGDLLVFLHADTRLGPAHLATLRQVAAHPGFGAGAFELQLTPPCPALQFISWGANWRVRLFSLPYGDQALSLRRSLFLALGGFAHRHPEDLDLVIRLKQHTRLHQLTPAVPSSGRSWLNQGYFHTTANHWLKLAWHLGERICTKRWRPRGELEEVDWREAASSDPS